jgi:Tfp pilus assembly PilM family ATPase
MSTSSGSVHRPKGSRQTQSGRIPVGIEAGENWVQVACPRQRGQQATWSVASCALTPRGLEAPQQIGRHLKSTLRSAGIPGGPAICALNSAAIEVFPLSLRRPDAAELDSQVVAQAREQLSYPVEEAVIDFAVLPAEHVRGGGDSTVVLTFAVRKTLTDAILQVLGRAGFTAERILTPACAVAPHLAQRSPGARQLLIATAECATSVSVVQDGQVLLERFLTWSVERLLQRLRGELELPEEQCRTLLTGDARRGARTDAVPEVEGALEAALEEILGPSFQELADETAGCVGYCDSFLQHQEISGVVLTGPMASSSHLRQSLRRSLELPLEDPGAESAAAQWGHPTDAAVFATAAGCALWSAEPAALSATGPEELAA